ncbi:MAG TPA: fenitrothion hydrolase, partial [Solirubrobacteraceae bacterium]|nr:fenitrothion hydrolase [Solirubrobacteraceae bacterium]
ALATLWAKPRLERAPSRLVLRLPRALDPICGALGVALFAIVLYAGFAGEQELPTANLAPTFIYVLFWVGLPFLSLPCGDVFRAFNPWRALARAVAWAAARAAKAPAPPKPSRRYPPWLGRWPAVAGILGFAWLELVYVEHDNPSTLAWLALAYAAVQLVGMRLYGIDTWTSRGDAFAVYFNLFSRLSPLHWRRDRLELRPPLAGVTSLEQLPGTVALLAAMIGSTSFDGLEQGSLWINSAFPELQALLANLGVGSAAASELSGSVGLMAMVAVVAGFYRLGIRGMLSIDPRTPADVLAARFVHTLVPIALAYVVAHYWSLFVYQSQALWYLASDPLGNGSNIFGTAGGQIDFSVLTPNSIWYVQVGALLLGHAAGLTLAHDRALVLYSHARDAIRSQYWMLVVMVGFTSLGLWLLSAAS